MGKSKNYRYLNYVRFLYVLLHTLGLVMLFAVLLTLDHFRLIRNISKKDY
jgi:hypothetical protein